MKKVNVLSVCGSGTVTSSMVAGKVKETLKEKGISVSTTEARPTEALNLAQSGRFDFIVYTSPLPAGDYKIPAINAFTCLTGIGEDQFFEEIFRTIDELDKK
jgi:galactitol PTS system EIIB component